jgi:hypothetical protein
VGEHRPAGCRHGVQVRCPLAGRPGRTDPPVCARHVGELVPESWRYRPVGERSQTRRLACLEPVPPECGGSCARRRGRAGRTSRGAPPCAACRPPGRGSGARGRGRSSRWCPRRLRAERLGSTSPDPTADTATASGRASGTGPADEGSLPEERDPDIAAPSQRRTDKGDGRREGSRGRRLSYRRHHLRVPSQGLNPVHRCSASASTGPCGGFQRLTGGCGATRHS